MCLLTHGLPSSAPGVACAPIRAARSGSASHWRPGRRSIDRSDVRRHRDVDVRRPLEDAVGATLRARTDPLHRRALVDPDLLDEDPGVSAADARRRPGSGRWPPPRA